MLIAQPAIYTWTDDQLRGFALAHKFDRIDHVRFPHLETPANQVTIESTICLRSSTVVQPAQALLCSPSEFCGLGTRLERTTFDYDVKILQKGYGHRTCSMEDTLLFVKQDVAFLPAALGQLLQEDCDISPKYIYSYNTWFAPHFLQSTSTQNNTSFVQIYMPDD
jgi:hypothetical protein